MANQSLEQPQSHALRDVTLAVVFVIVLFVAMYHFGRTTEVHSGDVRIGDNAPEIEFKTASGAATSLTKHRGKVLLINFWASWCGPCMEEMPSLRMLEIHFAKRPFSLYAFNIEESQDTLRGFVPDSNLPTNLVFSFSKEYLRPYNISAIPLSILVDRDGVMRDVFSGPRDWLQPEIIQEIEGLMK